ncbi:hypothetical protein XM38_039000 [Halomicronema hongdechloris C2206]|uniref:DUF1330 domain-containing protein n=1 Tax=Halomicronema hongdechloris C2206 TaxID=1641165 RepID=A0A1Z3HRK0_9CYAN|nr:DUF1330 domain-containing protein [Halomicronema hongdechloris]ASC72940.1 hypothetical protein XM38_039000 [Halomicronema hongdechloris C2206]
MSAYCVFDLLNVTDPEKMEQYRAGVFDNVARHGGKYLTVGGNPAVAEGHWQPNFLVVIEFPSLQQAHDWYDSDDYADLKALSLSGSESNAVFVEGF